jgi:hypothetical protein
MELELTACTLSDGRTISPTMIGIAIENDSIVIILLLFIIVLMPMSYLGNM